MSTDSRYEHSYAAHSKPSESYRLPVVQSQETVRVSRQEIRVMKMLSDDETETGSFSEHTAAFQPTAGTSVNPDCSSQKQRIDELSKPKTKANPEFDRQVVLTGLRYSLCSIRNLPAGLASHESVRNIFARNLVPESLTENSVHDLEGEEECKKMVLQTLINSIKSHDSSKSNEPEVMECVEKLQCGNLTDEEVWDELMELADSIADHQWELEKTELTTLLQNSAKIIRSRLEALQKSDEARDHCPTAKAWFGFMMAVWSCLRTLVSEGRDEAEKFKACIEPSKSVHHVKPSGPVHHVEPSGPVHHVEPSGLGEEKLEEAADGSGALVSDCLGSLGDSTEIASSMLSGKKEISELQFSTAGRMSKVHNEL